MYSPRYTCVGEGFLFILTILYLGIRVGSCVWVYVVSGDVEVAHLVLDDSGELHWDTMVDGGSSL